MEHVLEELCMLANAIAQASKVTVSLFCKHSNSLSLIARSTGSPQKIDGRFALNSLSSASPRLFVRNIADHPLLSKHPTNEAIPNLRSLAAFWLHSLNEQHFYFEVWNPSQDFFDNHFSTTALSHIVGIARELILARNSHVQIPSEPKNIPEIEPNSLSSDNEPASRFLIDTLVKKQRLLARNGCSYLALRQWRKTIKPYQISALSALKASAGCRLENAITSEVVEAIQKVYGNAFQCVVPIPPGSSGLKDSLSIRLAREVARKLKIPMIEALDAEPVSKSASHPKKSMKLAPYKIKADVKGNVLIIDDVATSGKHIEMATNALRPISTYCTSLVWIAD